MFMACQLTTARPVIDEDVRQIIHYQHFSISSMIQRIFYADESTLY